MMGYADLPNHGKFIISQETGLVRVEPQTSDEMDKRSVEMTDTSPLKAFDQDYAEPTIFYSLMRIVKPDDINIILDGMFMSHIMPIGGNTIVNGAGLSKTSRLLKKMPNLHMIYTTGTKLPEQALTMLGFKLIGSGSDHNVFAYQPNTLESRLMIPDNMLWDGFRQTGSKFYNMCQPTYCENRSTEMPQIHRPAQQAVGYGFNL